MTGRALATRECGGQGRERGHDGVSITSREPEGKNEDDGQRRARGYIYTPHCVGRVHAYMSRLQAGRADGKRTEAASESARVAFDAGPPPMIAFPPGGGGGDEVLWWSPRSITGDVQLLFWTERRKKPQSRS